MDQLILELETKLLPLLLFSTAPTLCCGVVKMLFPALI